MKKSFSFLKLLVVSLGIFLLITTGCISSNPSASSESPPRKKSGNDIWALLERGDNKAKGFFLGEVDVNETDPEGRTPLHYAAETGDDQLAAFFISLGANTDALDYENQSPLGISVEKNYAKVTEVIASAGANIHLTIYNPSREEYTTVSKLALKKNSSVLRALLTPDTAASFDSDGRTILHLASIEGNTQAVRDILSIIKANNTILVNKRDNNKLNALDYAFKRPDSRNHMEIAEQLILAGANSEDEMFYYFAPAARSANYNLQRNDGLSILHFAVTKRYTGLITFLLDKKVDVNIKSNSGATPLHEAVRTGNIQIMSVLIDNGADINSRDAKGNTALHTGVPPLLHREAISLLLNRGANPSLRDEHGDTPLHIVIILDRPAEIIQTLLAGSSDVQIRNIEGKTPLYIAVQEKRVTLIPLLLSYGSEIFAADNLGVTPFDLATKENDNIFKLLLSSDTINQRDSAGNTMLHAAVRNRVSPERIGLILDQKTPVDARNREGETALHIAVRMNQRETGEYLISRGANIFEANAAGVSPLYLALTASNGIRTWMINPTTIAAKDGFGNNMLHYAAQWKLNDAIPVIINNGISVEETNAAGETPLFLAIKTDSQSTIKALIDNKANLNTRDKQGNTALHAAVRWNAKDSVDLLISSGIDINSFSLNGSAPLHDAVSLGMTDIVTKLIKEGANLEVRDIDGNTPFMEAVKSGFLSSVEQLAANGADTFTRNINGDTPLHYSVSTEHYELVSILLRMGASIHSRNTKNITPFQISLNISPKMVSTLLTKERINASDDMGNSPLHIALQEKTSPEIIRAIINQGIRINSVDNNGRTALRLAVDMNSWEIAKILADNGADPFLAAVDNKTPADISFSKGEDCIRAIFSGKAINGKDNSANTILHLAARYGTVDIIQILLELGANKGLRNISSELPSDIALRWNRREIADLLK
jgi:ankyrin repeat protein